MNVVFMGTPEFARANLTALAESRHKVLAVVTGPDKPAGRNRTLQPTVCKVEAVRRGLPVLAPKSLKSDRLYDSLVELKPDLLVVAAFRILPPRLFGLARHGAINIHTSLLPKYRGAAPINWAIINGETETGLTSFFLKETVDTGDVILQEKTAIAPDDTFDSLHQKLCDQTGPFLLKTLDLIENGESRPLSQDDSQASSAPKLSPQDALIDFGFPAANVKNFVRGMSTRPGAYTWFRGRKLKLHFCEVADAAGEDSTRPGTVLPDRKRLIVQCSRSAVELTRLVPEGKKEMDGRAFLNGYRPEPDEILGEPPSDSKENK